MNNKATTFWKFLQENTIEIPIIQRDYAQGRNDKSYIRNSFLTNLKQALDENLPNGEKTLKLDFVYGSVEHDKLNPLDGQQRLTTLWLLHWYVALMAGKMNEATDVLKKFTYETRITSREFCQQLCNADNFKDYFQGSVADYITKRTWFYSAWKQDPTIQALLTMIRGTKETDKNEDDILDGIEELFATTETENFVKYWERLVSENAPIVFYYLPLKDFGLSDDLYIKMNARGKQLTNFENFKADLIGYIEQSARDTTDDQIKGQWNALLNPVNGLPIKLDTAWMDIFWKNKSIGVRDSQGKISKSHQVDEIYFTFLNRLFWNELFIAKDGTEYILEVGKDDDSSVMENENKSYSYLNDSGNRNEKFERIAYLGLDNYKYHNNTIPVVFLKKAETILDNYLKYTQEGFQLPVCQWNKDFHFIPQYVFENSFNVEYSNNSNEAILKVAALTQPERIVFFALCKYFEEESGTETSLKQWLRVVWNLVSGEGEDGKPQIRSTRAVRKAIEFISALDSHDVYHSLAEFDLSKIDKDAFDQKCKEEIEKAKKIVEDENWEDKIIQAENCAAFNGSISFLFTDENGKYNWNDFGKKFNNLQEIIDEKGLKSEYKDGAKAIKIILSYCDSWWYQIESHPHDNHFIFSDSFNCWKNNILLKFKKDGIPLYASPVHHLLVGDGPSDSVPNDLTDDWRRSSFRYLTGSSVIYDCYKDNRKDKFYVRWIYNNLCLYPSSEGFILSMPFRDKMLFSCLDNKIIELIHKSQKQAYGFWGWNVNFKFHGINFQWCYDDYIYLLENDLGYKIKKSDASNEDEKYYRFNADSISDSNLFVEKLMALANQPATEESNCADEIGEHPEIQ